MSGNGPKVAELAETGDASERQRVATLEFTGLLEDRGTETFDRVSRLTRRLLGADTALVSLVGTDRQSFVGQDGLNRELWGENGSPISYSFCRYAVASGENFVVADARTSPLLREHPAIAERDVVAYAGVPLQVSTGEVLGALCAIHSSPRRWSEHDVATLEELAAFVRAELDHRLRLRQGNEIETLALRLPDPMGRLSDVVRTTATLAEHPEDPRLPRTAYVARDRLTTVEMLTRDLEKAIQVRRPADVNGPVRLDLGVRLRHALGLVRAAARPQDIVTELSDEPVEVNWPAARLDRALSLLLVTAMLHMDEHSALTVLLAATEDEARITVTAPGYAVPLTQVMRVVGAFAPEGDAEAPVDVSARPGGARVRNQWVSVLSCPEGTTFEVVLPVAGAGSVVPAQRNPRR